eukprot:365942-Chlamydomonas_euryale.AAC.50
MGPRVHCCSYESLVHPKQPPWCPLARLGQIHTFLSVLPCFASHKHNQAGSAHCNSGSRALPCDRMCKRRQDTGHEASWLHIGTGAGMQQVPRRRCHAWAHAAC